MVRALLVIAFCAWHTQAIADKPVILVLGDSLSAGYGIDAHQGWVALLQQRLDQQGYRYHVVNASISGDTTLGGLARLPQALAQHRPSLVIVELGGNDGLRALSLNAMRENLASIISTSREHGAKVMLVGVRLPPNYGASYVSMFHNVYRKLARAYRVPLVPYLLDGIGGRKELMQADQVHPQAQAQARMLDNVWLHLVAMLKNGGG